MISKSLSTAHIACVKILLECIAKKDYKIEYGQIVDEISISPNKIGSVLGDISTICHELGLPLISVMVVQKNTNVCGPGFFELCEKLNIHAKCNELLEEVKKCKHWNILADYFKINVVGISSQQDTLLNSIQTEIVEGDLIQINSTRYERDKEIRSECLRIHGTKCKICGFDASKVYGEDFIGKIHVHHITPLSFIKSEHKVDPEIDVIPVCPNCHMIIHSKSEGVYTPEEVKQMIDKTK